MPGETAQWPPAAAVGTEQSTLQSVQLSTPSTRSQPQHIFPKTVNKVDSILFVKEIGVAIVVVVVCQ